MTLFLTQVFALLAVAVLVGLGATLASPRFRAAVQPHAVGAAAAITGTATAGSLYLSEVAGYVPCELCWAQRIFMYPVAVILLVGLLARRPATEAFRYAAPLAGLGLATSIWHVIIQRLPVSQGSCDPDNPCSAIIIERFGFLTIPTMAGIAFLAVLVLWGITRGTGGVTPTTPEHDTRDLTSESIPS
ncbi:disulfide bond formation protein B [Euzebya tangerina]|uniref:disulfide bond formation protein B n=1 Tax=Euzebya tangerina TaxID=591198 RepID=UPI000E32355F|nr:disulfide bond formation protein B [Euzebya tangerina]